MELLERGAALDVLAAAAESAAAGHGRVVVIEGPTGIGKSALLERFLAVSRLQVVSGRCDELSIPRTLGPFVDAAFRGDLDPDSVATTETLGRQLLTSIAATPTVVAIDDAHWADAATVDIITLIGRRIGDLQCVLLLAMRDDRTLSPARAAIGVMQTEVVDRVVLEPLSPEAIGRLAGSHGELDVDEIHHATGGNPFLAVELVRSPDRVSGTIRDRVSAAITSTASMAQRLAAMLAVSPEGLAWPVVEHAADGWEHAVDELEGAGLVETSSGGVRFVHDIVRRAAHEGLTGARRRRSHLELLALLVESRADPAVIAHHAAAVGDVDVLITSSIDAARAAADAGAHTEALRHVERVLPHAGRLDQIDRGHLYEIAMVEYQLNLRLDDALRMGHERLALTHVRSDPSLLSATYRALSRIEWAIGDSATSREHLETALAVLDGEVGPAELARRHIDVTTDLAMSSRWDDAATWAARTLDVVDDVVDARSYAQAHGASELILSVVGDPVTARRHGDQAIAVFRRDGINRDLSITLGNRVANALNTLRLHDYPAAIDDAMAAVEQDDSVATEGWFAGLRARYALHRGTWEEAEALVDRALELNPHGLHRAGPLVTRALLRARRGGDGEADLAEARSLVGRLSDIQRIGLTAVAEAEIAWLGGSFDQVFFERALALARTSGHRRFFAELVVWQRRLRHETDDTVTDGPAPLLAELDGRWADAAVAWEELGCPYERALTLAWSGDVDALQEGAQIARTLGATRAADRIRHQLRAAGVTVATGPRAATRANPAGLTNRQYEVAQLVADGMTNGEIADRLFVSVKTVDHHVSAILMKLGVANRRDAAVRLAERAAEPEEGIHRE